MSDPHPNLTDSTSPPDDRLTRARTAPALSGLTGPCAASPAGLQAGRAPGLPARSDLPQRPARRAAAGPFPPRNIRGSFAGWS